MFFIGKIVGLLLHPLLWIVILVVIALFTRDMFLKKRRLILAGVLILFFSNPWIIARLCLAWQPGPMEMGKEEVYETGILLGGFAGHDRVEGWDYFGDNADRFLEAYRLYKTGHIKKILISGANGNPLVETFVESEFAKSRLLELGVPGSDILVEGRSRNTIENAEFSKALLDSAGIKGKQVLITSALHMRRSVLIFQKAGIEVRPYPCAYRQLPQDGRFGWNAFVPSARSFDLWDALLREWVGHVVARLRK